MSRYYCFFCGSEPVITKKDVENGVHVAHVTCKTCDTTYKITRMGLMTRKEVLELLLI